MSSSRSHFPVLAADVIVPANGTSVSISGLSLSRMRILGGPTAYANFAVDAPGNLTVDTTGSNVMVQSSDAVRVLNTTASTTSSTGAVIVSGGMGVAERINAGGAIATVDTTASSSISTGSGVFAGGVGIAGKLWVGDDLNVAGQFICRGYPSMRDVVYSGPWGATTHTGPIYFRKYGTMVICRVTPIIGAASVSTQILVPAGAIPTGFLPDLGHADITFSIQVLDNSIMTNGFFTINGDGGLIFGVSPGLNFTAAGGAGFPQFQVTWMTE
jgi:hypothetical protein